MFEGELEIMKRLASAASVTSRRTSENMAIDPAMMYDDARGILVQPSMEIWVAGPGWM